MWAPNNSFWFDQRGRGMVRGQIEIIDELFRLVYQLHHFLKVAIGCGLHFQEKFLRLTNLFL
jgi:hypothetical protein